MTAITSVQDLFEALASVHAEFRRGQVWWRGQRKGWPLRPSVHRVGDRGPYERGVVHSFRSLAPSRYGPSPAPTDFQAWLFLMQHHGAPTRLLDWSGSPLVALFFAVRPGRHDDEDGELFCVDPWALNKATIGVEATVSSYELGTFFEAAFADRPPPAKTETVVAITAEETTPRSVAQQSRFTIHGTRRPLDELEGQSSFLRRWKVPSGAKRSIAKQLSRAGIVEHRLFPDLDHLAQWVESRCFCGQCSCTHQGSKPDVGLDRDSV